MMKRTMMNWTKKHIDWKTKTGRLLLTCFLQYVYSLLMPHYQKRTQIALSAFLDFQGLLSRLNNNEEQTPLTWGHGTFVFLGINPTTVR